MLPLKLPSMVSFQMDKSFQQKRFIQNQSDLNEFIKKNHKNNNYYNEAQQITGLSTSNNLPQMSRLKFNQSGVDSRIQGKMLQDQMQLRNLESQYNQQKTKIEDQHNAKTFRKKYPYGKQNVKITEDVIEKYKVNTYLDQSEMLKRFQQEARKRKQQQKSQRRNALEMGSRSADNSELKAKNYNYNYNRSTRKKTSILQKQIDRLYEAKQRYLSGEQKKWKRSQQKEKYNKNMNKKNLDKIEYALKQVRQNLNIYLTKFSSRLDERQKQQRLKRQGYISRQRLQKLSQLAKQQDFYRRKLPVVVYNNQKDTEKNYFSRIVCGDIDNYERKSNIGKAQQFSQVFNIYNMNKKRMDMLSEKVDIKRNKSIF